MIACTVGVEVPVVGIVPVGVGGAAPDVVVVCKGNCFSYCSVVSICS